MQLYIMTYVDLDIFSGGVVISDMVLIECWLSLPLGTIDTAAPSKECFHHVAKLVVPSGKLAVCYRKSPSLMGKSTISMSHFQ